MRQAESHLQTPQHESALAAGVRRGAGYVSLAALAVSIGGAVLAFERLAVAGLLVFAALPHLVMIGHLIVTDELSPQEKAVWRRQLRWKYTALVAVWAYLFARDLRQRTRGFRRYAER